MSLKLNKEEERLGVIWLSTAGVLAALFAFWLYSVDNKLTYSKREQILKKTLYELRTAQAMVGDGLVDERLQSSITHDPNEFPSLNEDSSHGHH
ncbi:MAG: hypothetical protein D6780_01595 [Candidatus Dadabacteria bacterium]|nr:MAG: hypothetical protein D6780_01595 [Candidatus Dadabacteria bacterium]